MSLQHQNIPPTNEISIQPEENELYPRIEQDNNADDDKGYRLMDNFDDAAPNDFNKKQLPDASPTHHGSTDNVPDIIEGGFEKIMCPLPTGIQPKAGANMLEAMLKDPLLEKCLAMGCVYYLFADKEDWDVAA
ncbi:hypothetical protein H0H87_010346 [Tephrocybe sp. NHM501043]|nr:hypothetical protein H0H87_010346 [Tephrocybe sp. NHM501043]